MFNTPELSRSTLSPFGSRNTSRRSITTSVTPGQSSRSFVRLSSRPTIPTRVLEETQLHRVETYGLPLPVQVNEIIPNVTERSPPVSVQLDPSGWAWLVFERRLLVWRYRSLETTKVTYCKEFQLPTTELHHTANLICMVGSPGLDYRQYGILAVSPEGMVRYWPSMANESSPIETETELVGQEFHSLTELQPYCYILATSTNDILLLSVQKKSVNCHRFRASGSVFSGFGRRMSSFIFGSEESSTTRLHKVMVDKSTMEQSKYRALYVLSGNTLQKWIVEGQSSGMINEKHEMDWNVGILFEQRAVQRFQVSLDKVKSFCFDAQLCSAGILVLSAVLVQNPEADESHMYYFLGTFDVNSESETFGHFSLFVQLRFAELYKETMHQNLLSFKLLLPCTSRQAFVYSDNIIVCSSVKNTEDVLNKVELQSNGDAIWGSGYSENTALFFSRKHGIINVTVTSEAQSDCVSEQRPRTEQTDASMAVHLAEGENDDVAVLRKAFLQFCQGNKGQAQTTCEERFNDVTVFDGSILDAAVANVSKEIIDDYPASDPRWAEAMPTDSGSSSASVIIIHQLEDKLKAHDYFVQFLKETMLFDKLSTVNVRGRIMCTRHLLCEYAEKVKFAIALRQQHNKYQVVVDHSIAILLKDRDQEDAPKGLTLQDLFYREVSRISDIIGSLLEYERLKLSQHKNQVDHQELVLDVNNILESTLHEAWQYRQMNAPFYSCSGNNEPKVEFLPWTASCGPDGIRSLLLEQIEITYTRALPLAEDLKARSVFVQQVVDLSDIFLDGYLTQINSLRNLDDEAEFQETSQKYEQDRHRVIYPLVSRGFVEEASSLAEKYRDFNILVEICEENRDQDKLQHYMLLFKDDGFSDFAFKWYMDRGKPSKLMSQPSAQHENLSKFLSTHDHLKWLHDIERQSFYQACETLVDLAEKEDRYLARKKTFLSLGLLALLCSDESKEDLAIQRLEEIRNQQVMITHQETISVDVLQNASLDPVSMPPVSPEQLIELHIGDINKNSDECDFKKALDVLQIAYANEAERDRYDKLRLQIWCKAILKDDWTNLDGDDPLMIARNTIFFKTVELAYHQGVDLAVYMPSLESFLGAEELNNSGLAENATFQFLLRAGFEQILRSQDDTEME